MSDHDEKHLVYELTRENKSLMMSLNEGDLKLADLNLRVLKLEDGHIELVVKLENANDEISRLSVKFQDAEKEIGTLKLNISP